MNRIKQFISLHKGRIAIMAVIMVSLSAGLIAVHEYTAGAASAVCKNVKGKKVCSNSNNNSQSANVTTDPLIGTADGVTCHQERPSGSTVCAVTKTGEVVKCYIRPPSGNRYCYDKKNKLIGSKDGSAIKTGGTTGSSGGSGGGGSGGSAGGAADAAANNVLTVAAKTGKTVGAIKDTTGNNQDPVSGKEVKKTSVIDYVNGTYTWAAILGGLLAVLMIVYAGYRYMTSYGDPEKIADAKNIIEQSLIGLGLLILAALILQTINPDILHCVHNCGDIDFSKAGG